MVRSSMVPMLLVCGSLAAQDPAATRLSLREAIQTSLQNNLQVEIAQQAREVTRAGVAISQGPFDWNLNAGASVAWQKEVASNSLGTRSTAASTNRDLTAALSKAFEWGGSASFGYAPAYSYTHASDGSWSSGSPYTGALTAKYTQSLLQGFGREVTGAPLVIARKNSAAADYTYQLAIINLVADTESKYWAVVYAQRNLGNAQTSLELAQKQLKENEIRLQVGTLAPIEVTSAEAQVAQAEQNIIAAQAQLDNAKDALIRALYPNAERPAGLELTDAPTLSHTQLDEGAAVKMALERRVELKSARLNQEVGQLQLKVAEDKVKPQLNAFVGYNGATNSYDALGPVNTDLTGAKYPGYSVGLSFAMPIQNHAAQGGLATARANLRSSELGLRDQELSVILDVRTAIRNVDATEKGVTAAAKTRFYQEKNLEAEQKKFENGMSTNFTVLQVMTNLDAARSAETQAQINYANAVTALEKSVGNLLEARDFVIK